MRMLSLSRIQLQLRWERLSLDETARIDPPPRTFSFGSGGASWPAKFRHDDRSLSGVGLGADIQDSASIAKPHRRILSLGVNSDPTVSVDRDDRPAPAPYQPADRSRCLPLGTFDDSYGEQTYRLVAGDTLLLMSDGFPELPDAAGEPFGYARVRELFASVAAREPDAIVAELTAAVAERTGGGAPSDDVTFVVLRVR